MNARERKVNKTANKNMIKMTVRPGDGIANNFGHLLPNLSTHPAMLAANGGEMKINPIIQIAQRHTGGNRNPLTIPHTRPEG